MKSKSYLALACTIIVINLTACGNDNKSNSVAITQAPDTATPIDNTDLTKVFSKNISVFGIPIYGTTATLDEALLHAANVMAQYLDNDENGVPDNQMVVDKMIAEGATLIIANDENDLDHLFDKIPESDALQDLYVEEMTPDNGADGKFDATLEEVLHLITHVGYVGVYPDIFGEATGAVIADAMDMARGGQFETIPASYPAGAWYTYDDQSCNYSCMVTEYTYWSLTSILGAQNFTGRLEQIEQEWKLNTADKIQNQDAAVYTLLTDSQYGLATILPDGNYQPIEFEITHTGERQTTFTFKDNDLSSKTVYMNGLITSNTLTEMTALFEQHPQITTLVMQNVPGSMDDDINLLAAREIRKRGIATHIPADGMVASGGTDMFLAGAKRTIELGSKLGVHSWSSSDQAATDYPRDSQEHVKYLDYYQEMNIDTEFYWYTLEAAPAEDIHWMTEQEIAEYGVLTE